MVKRREALDVNRISEYRHHAGMDIDDMASRAGLDVMEVALAERGIGLVHYDVVIALADALDAHPGELYPSLSQHFREIEASEEGGDFRNEMLSPERSSALLMAGVDPDISYWYVIVKLKSGNERRYLLSSSERENIRSELAATEDSEGFLVFNADCRNVAIRKSAIAELQITNAASYASFSSRESAFKVVIVSPRSPRPETIAVVPDGGEDGRGPRPFKAFMDAARSGKATSKFLLLEDDGDEIFIGIDRLEVLEVPLGVLMPDLYGEECPPKPVQRGDTLESLEIMGEA